MLQTEYIRSLNCNYERLLLERKPEENRYQYCIVSRGGIRGLLPCSLRYINDQAFLYYDITSMQNVAQLYSGRTINRTWMRDFLWGMQQVKQELGRFLLDDRNVVWHAEHIFQDLESNEFSFLYIPYYEGECGFLELIEFWVEHIDYEDEALVEFVYKTHEQFELLGSVYLQEQIFEDSSVLEQSIVLDFTVEESTAVAAEDRRPYDTDVNDRQKMQTQDMEDIQKEEKFSKKGLRYLLEGKKKKQKEERVDLIKRTEQLISETNVDLEQISEPEDYGKTIYIEETAESNKIVRRLYTNDDKIMTEITKNPFVIGKKKEEVDCYINDKSVSRVHARIVEEEGKLYLEDLNATNGTYKNGLRMQPYEKKLLEPYDEIKLGKVTIIYR